MWKKQQIQEIIDSIIPDENVEVTGIDFKKGFPMQLRWVELDEHSKLIDCEETVKLEGKPTVTITQPRN